MKKLSIEEKAKAYDKKLAEAKEMLIDGCISQNTIDCIQKLYPELKCSTDSEDERIINNIRKVIRWYRGIFTEKSLMPEQYQEINAWLEKQGNIDRHIKLPTFTFDDVLALQCCMETVKKVQEDKELYSQLQSLHSRLYDAYWLEKQGEQKPIDLVAILKNYFTNTPKEQQDKDWEELKHLNNFGWELVEQKPTEWSEEDESMRTRCIGILGKCYMGELPTKVEEELNWLKFLRPQMQWKAVDKEIYVKEPVLAQRKDKSEPNHGYVICYDHTLTPDVYERFIMISDIYNQSHWKPSDEQMNNK